MDHHPQRHRETQSKPDQIAGDLVCGLNGFALGAAQAYGHDRERPDKERAKNDGQYSQAHRDGRCRRPDVRSIELRRFGAHGLNLPSPRSGLSQLNLCPNHQSSRLRCGRERSSF